MKKSQLREIIREVLEEMDKKSSEQIAMDTDYDAQVKAGKRPFPKKIKVGKKNESEEMDEDNTSLDKQIKSIQDKNEKIRKNIKKNREILSKQKGNPYSKPYIDLLNMNIKDLSNDIKQNNQKMENLRKQKTTTNESEEIDEVAPPGREKQVKALKKVPGITNPFAVAWASYNKSKRK